MPTPCGTIGYMEVYYEARIKALEKVLQRVLDHISETRGTNASDAVHDARVLLSMSSTSTEPNRCSQCARGTDHDLDDCDTLEPAKED